MATKNTAAGNTAAAGTAPVVFADKKFKNRTVVLADGRTFLVEKSRIVATDPALIDKLDKDSDFERLSAGKG